MYACIHIFNFVFDPWYVELCCLKWSYSFHFVEITKALRTDRRTDGPTDQRTNGPTDQRTDIPSYRDAIAASKNGAPNPTTCLLLTLSWFERQFYNEINGEEKRYLPFCFRSKKTISRIKRILSYKTFSSIRLMFRSWIILLHVNFHLQ